MHPTRDDFAGLPARYPRLCGPHIVGLGTQAKVTLASGILHAMSCARPNQHSQWRQIEPPS
jgi:uncharacterized protein